MCSMDVKCQDMLNQADGNGFHSKNAKVLFCLQYTPVVKIDKELNVTIKLNSNVQFLNTSVLYPTINTGVLRRLLNTCVLN